MTQLEECAERARRIPRKLHDLADDSPIVHAGLMAHIKKNVPFDQVMDNVLVVLVRENEALKKRLLRMMELHPGPIPVEQP